MGGPWLHRFMTSSITASIQLAANDDPHLTFITQAEILERANTTLSCPVEITDPQTGRQVRKDLKPDALFGLECRQGEERFYRFFVVEADRSTEPYTATNFNRKSVLRNVLQYREYIANGVYKDHLKLTAPLLVLNVCSDAARSERMRQFIADESGGSVSYQLFQAWEAFQSPFRPPEPNTGLLTGRWGRPGGEGLCIGKV